MGRVLPAVGRGGSTCVVRAALGNGKGLTDRRLLNLLEEAVFVQDGTFRGSGTTECSNAHDRPEHLCRT